MPASWPVETRGLAQLAGLAEVHAGLCIRPDQLQLVENRLRRRMRMLGLDSLAAYALAVRRDASGTELDHFLDLLTTQHTSFFREPEPFYLLTTEFVPRIRAVLRSSEPIRIWSAAVATGEEAYTLAVLAAERAIQYPDDRWHIQASDISRRALQYAKRGVYPMSRLEAVPEPLIRSSFERGTGPREGQCRVARAVRERVHFLRINLLDAEYPIGEPQHVIFCRNVLIYFSPETRLRVVNTLCSHLVPNGYLVVGYSESLTGLVPGLESIGHGVYQRQ